MILKVARPFTVPAEGPDVYVHFVLPKGTVVKAEFTWDNTAANPRNPNSPPKLIKWGEGSEDEMSGLIIGGITVHPWDELGMWASVIGHYFEVEGKANEAKRQRERAAPRRE